VVSASTLPTKLEQSTELVTVTLNALTISNGSTVKQTYSTGPHLLTILTLVLVDMEPVVTKWTFGKQTLCLLPSLLMCALLPDNTDAPVMIVVMVPIATVEFATRMVATSIPSVLARGYLGNGGQFQVDTTKPFTVVTQFVTTDGTDNGDLQEIRRVYVQNGRTIPNSKVNFPGIKQFDSVSDSFCSTLKNLFGDKNDFAAKGGIKKMGASLARGMVLVMSLWDDHAAHMLWLDSNYPTTVPPSQPGIARGNCSTSSGVPSQVESQYPNSNVIFSNIRSGDIGSTTNGNIVGEI